jgi:hypothetical protein
MYCAALAGHRKTIWSPAIPNLDESLLAKNRVSNNVGGVKHFWGALALALGRARHFALVEELPFQPKARS